MSEAITPTNGEQAFALAQRQAKALASSDLVPTQYRGDKNLGNVLIAMEMAQRLHIPTLAVMQHMHVIQGRPSWSASFLIATINASGKFSPLRYEFAGETGTSTWACRAVARDVQSGEVLEGTWITWIMAQKEGWLSKSGSKWLTMPEQMMRYRAAAFWQRAFCPEIGMGFLSTEEVIDIVPPAVAAAASVSLPAQLTPSGAASLEAVIGIAQTAVEVVEVAAEPVEAK